VQIDIVGLGQLAGTGIGTHVETNDHGLGRNGQVDVGLADAAHAGIDQLHPHLFGRELEQRRRQRFLRALHVGLDDDGQRLDLAGLHVGKHVFQLGGLLFGQFGRTELACTVGGDLAGTALVGHDHELVAGLWHFGQALNFDRNRRPGFFAGFAVFVEHGAHTARGLPCQHHVAHFEGTRLHQHGCHRTTPFVKAGFNHQPFGKGVDRGLEFEHFGLQ